MISSALFARHSTTAALQENGWPSRSYWGQILKCGYLKKLPTHHKCRHPKTVKLFHQSQGQDTTQNWSFTIWRDQIKILPHAIAHEHCRGTDTKEFTAPNYPHGECWWFQLPLKADHGYGWEWLLCSMAAAPAWSLMPCSRLECSVLWCHLLQGMSQGSKQL